MWGIVEGERLDIILIIDHSTKDTGTSSNLRECEFKARSCVQTEEEGESGITHKTEFVSKRCHGER